MGHGSPQVTSPRRSARGRLWRRLLPAGVALLLWAPPASAQVTPVSALWREWVVLHREITDARQEAQRARRASKARRERRARPRTIEEAKP
ncbi:MAG: hypothetical protein KC549_15390 [Myxococcales bacterium]|nr:hypothetical protein [Myxococcales bacterium]